MRRLVRRLRKARKAGLGRPAGPGIADSRGPVASNSRNPQTRITAADAEAIAADHLAGASVDALAERYGVSPRTVRSKLAKAGLTNTRPSLTEEQIAAAVRSYESGATLAELRVDLHVCDKTLRRHLVEAGVTIWPRGRRAGAT
ncbi:MAG: hypothetical protein LBL01_00575 [Bifidobacteriaceae bacterium]|jgi:transposase-like protein|nr:hypothetical protein [Bifidobacteriaceae bacterium]